MSGTDPMEFFPEQRCYWCDRNLSRTIYRVVAHIGVNAFRGIERTCDKPLCFGRTEGWVEYLDVHDPSIF